MPESLERIQVGPKHGCEPFHTNCGDLNYCLTDFWRWSVSDLVSNATRGRLAEFIVAKALGCPIDSVRNEWGAYDLDTPDGLKVEVKSAAFIQSWSQQGLSSIQFLTRKTRAWDPDTNRQSNESKRQANVYVFALLAHKDKNTIDPLNVDQWEFYVLPTTVLDQRKRSQHSITLKTLENLSGGRVDYEHLRDVVTRVASGKNEKAT